MKFVDVLGASLISCSSLASLHCDELVTMEQKKHTELLTQSNKNSSNGQASNNSQSLSSAPKNSWDMTDDVIINTGASPVLKDGIRLNVDAAFIYWYASQSGLEFYRGEDNNTATFAEMTNQAQFRGPKFKMQPGFKVGVGSDVRHDGWDVYLNYTRIVSNTDMIDTLGPDDAGFVTASYVIDNVTSNPASSARCSWHMSINALDLELGRGFFVSPSLILRPYAGLKNAWQNQRVNPQLIGFESPAEDDSALFSNTSSKLAFKTWGIGVRGGLEGCWLLGKGFGIESNLALSALWSTIHSSLKRYIDTQDSSISEFVNRQYVYSYRTLTTHRLIPILELALGLSYEHELVQNSLRLKLSATWEEQIWWNSLSINNAVTGSGDSLNLEGLTFKVRLDF